MEESLKYPSGMQMRYSQKDERQYLQENSPYPITSRNPQGHKSSPTNQFLNFVKGKFKIAFDSVKNAFNWNSDSTANALEDLSKKNNLGPIFDKMRGQNSSQEANDIENLSQGNRTRIYDIGDAKKSSFLNVLKFHKEILTYDIKTKMDNEKLTIIPRLTHCQNIPKLIRHRTKFVSFEKLSQGYRAIRFDEYGNVIPTLKDSDFKDTQDDTLPSLIKSDSKMKLKKQVTFSNQKLSLERRTSKLIGYNPIYDTEGENPKPQTQKKIKLANGKYIYANQELITLNLKSKPKPKEVQIYKKPTKSSLTKSSLMKSQESFSKHREHVKLDKQYIHESSFASDFNVNDSKLETDEEDNYYNNRMISSSKKSKRRSAEFDDEYEQQYDNDDELNLPQSPIHKREDGDDEENEDDNADILDNVPEVYEDELHTSSNIEPIKSESSKKKDPEVNKADTKKVTQTSFSLFTNKQSSQAQDKQDSPKKESPTQEEKKEERNLPTFGGMASKPGLLFGNLNSQKTEIEKPKEKDAEEKPKSSSLFSNLNSIAKPTTDASEEGKTKSLFSFNNKKPEEAKPLTDEKKPESSAPESLSSTQSTEPEKPKLFSGLLSKTTSEPKVDDKKSDDINKASEPIAANKADSPLAATISQTDEKKEETEKSALEKAPEEKKVEAKEPSKLLFQTATSSFSLSNAVAAPSVNPFAKLTQNSDASKSTTETSSGSINPFFKAAPLNVGSNDNAPFKTASTNNASPFLKNPSSIFSNENKPPENNNPTPSLESKANNLFAGILGNQSNTNSGPQPGTNSSLISGNPIFSNNNTSNGGIFSNAPSFSIGGSSSMNNNSESKPGIFGSLGSNNSNSMNFNNNNNSSNTAMSPFLGNINNSNSQPQNSSMPFGLGNSSSNSNPFLGIGGGNNSNSGNSSNFLGGGFKPNNNQGGNTNFNNLTQARGAAQSGPRKAQKDRAFG